MDEQPTDDDLRALRGLDPAAGARAPEALRQRLAAMSAGDEDESTSLGARRRRWLAPIAAASLAVATAASVFALGAGGGTSAASVALMTTAPGEIAAPVELGAAGRDSGSMSPEVKLQAAGDSLFSLPWTYGERHRFTVPMFDDTPGEATVYVVDSGSWYTAEQAARVAAALGVPGEPVLSDYGGWSVHTYETGGTAGVSLWNGGNLDYFTGLEDPTRACYDHAGRVGGEAFQTAVAQCAAAIPMPTDEQARAALSAFLAAIGIDQDTVSVTVVAGSEQFARTLTAVASRVVDGMAMPVSISTTVSFEGLIHGYGTIGDLVPLGGYRTVSPADAAERLNTSAFAPERSSDSSVVFPVSETAPQGLPPALPEPGSAVPWAIAEHTIVSARLGLSAVYPADGLVYVVPAYEFTDTDGGKWSVIALTEDGIDPTAPTLHFVPD